MNIFFLFFSLFFITLSFYFFLKNPLIMGFFLILSTMFMCIFLCMYSFSSWNCYILFLMFLGGILILFLYNISLISTEIFSNMKILNFFLFMIFVFFLLIIQNIKETYFNDSLNFFNQQEISCFFTFFLKYNFNSILFLIIYIFLSLICVVNLIYLMKDKGSMK
uniref:NADH dehydrogenase subunit 6 n=1 Tax=Gynaikothrips ficorum TaxID=59752 RepID=A0A7M1LBU7_GYNFI|nr:NADH dehydrogenase subunit 6 [Gynaikothrips ficorum]QOQ85873.1 NADH dehydrogenase subunit 6 [Gynaikothrips ficorum]